MIRPLVPSLRDLVLLFSSYPGLTSWAIICRPSGAWGKMVYGLPLGGEGQG